MYRINSFGRCGIGVQNAAARPQSLFVLDVRGVTSLTTGGTLIEFFLEGFFYGDLGKEVAAGHDRRMASTEFLCQNRTELMFGLGEFH